MKRAAIALVMFVWAITLAAAEDAANSAAGERIYSAERNAASRLPGAALNLNLAAPIATWDEAIPLGNGLLGGLLWGEGDTIRLSLDRGDLWDERPAAGMQWDKFTYANLKRWVAAGDEASIADTLDRAYRDAHPTKIPAGRLEIRLAPGQRVTSFTLDLARAEGLAEFASGQRLTAFFGAAQPVALVRISGPEPRAIELLTPADVANATDKNGKQGGGAFLKLEYPSPARGRDGAAIWYVQQAAEGLEYCVLAGTRRVDDATLLALTVATNRDGADPRAVAAARVRAALESGFEKMRQAHAAWWRAFWSQSAVSLPAADADILRQYYLVQYFYGAASRRGAPPMPLQGVWTADAGGLPPWKGDYHNDLNTQMTYIAYQEAGHFDEGLSYLDFLWERRPVFQKFAGDFYAAPGLATPGVMSLAGRPLAGWVQYSLSPTMSAWSAHLFYLHWRYTMDEAFLRRRAYPWCADVGECMLALLKPDAAGVLKLPLSSSPEIFGNSRRAWLEPNSNYDLMSLKMLFLALTEMAEALGKTEETQRWAAAAAALGPFHAAADGTLLLDARTSLTESHRHLSNIIGLYPFNLITRDGGDSDNRMIRASLAQWDKLGTSAWCGYSFSWMSCLRARVGDAESALRRLDIFVKAFILRNGFHVNGDQTRSGFSRMTYRPFTLEGNFLAAQAVQEMLLQSWSPAPGRAGAEIIRIFPATPWRWHDASFTNLRAEGGHRVSARRENNATTWLRLTAGHEGVVRIRDNFGGREPQWSRAGVKKIAENFEVSLKRGEVLEARLSKPAAMPVAPANAAKPVVIGEATGRKIAPAGKAAARKVPKRSISSR